MLNKINRKRFYAIFIPAVIILLLFFIFLLNINFFKKQYAHHYYQKAEQALYDLDKDKSTAYIIKALNADPELNSSEYRELLDKRKEFLKDEDNKNQYFNQ